MENHFVQLLITNQEEKKMAKELLLASLRMERNPMAIPITDPFQHGRG